MAMNSAFDWRFGFGLPRTLLFNNFERTLDFFQQSGKISRQQRLFRVHHDVHVQARARARNPYRFAQPALHAVTLDCTTQRAAHGKSDANPLSRRWTYPRVLLVVRSRQVKNCDRRRKVATAQLIDAFEVSMPQKASTAGKLSHPGGGIRVLFRHDGGHSVLILPDVGAAMR